MMATSRRVLPVLTPCVSPLPTCALMLRAPLVFGDRRAVVVAPSARSGLEQPAPQQVFGGYGERPRRRVRVAFIASVAPVDVNSESVESRSLGRFVHSHDRTGAAEIPQGEVSCVAESRGTGPILVGNGRRGHEHPAAGGPALERFQPLPVLVLVHRAQVGRNAEVRSRRVCGAESHRGSPPFWAVARGEYFSVAQLHVHCLACQYLHFPTRGRAAVRYGLLPAKNRRA